MGLLDDAIREHLELKRRRGAASEEVTRQEHEALGAPQRGEFAATPDADADAGAGVEPAEPAGEPLPEEPAEPREDPAARVEDEPPAPPPPAPDDDGDRDAEDVLEETPEFLQETPEHDRLWFEQKPPRDFDLDR